MDIREILKLSQDELYKYVCSFMDKLQIPFEHSPNRKWIFARGSSPVLLVAHLDTVHRNPPRRILCDEEHTLLWSPDGIGGDDRCGVYAILAILADMPSKFRPSVLFTTDEEIGGLGVQDFMQTYPVPPMDLRYIIELDRAGDNDCVFYRCYNPEFEKYVQKYWFKEAYGSFTDISFLAPQWGIAAVNLSCGYYNPQTLSEYIDMEDLYYTVARVESMIDDSPNVAMFKYIPLTPEDKILYPHWSVNDLYDMEGDDEE